jgi:hypothetical protein
METNAVCFFIDLIGESGYPLFGEECALIWIALGSLSISSGCAATCPTLAGSSQYVWSSPFPLATIVSSRNRTQWDLPDPISKSAVSCET